MCFPKGAEGCGWSCVGFFLDLAVEQLTEQNPHNGRQTRFGNPRLGAVTLEEHCEQSMAFFGEPFEEVHRWLDEFAGKTEFRHRRLRHHEEGIQEIISLYGEKAGRVARLHIVSDLKEEGYWKGDPFPWNKEDYVRLGFR